MKVYQLARRLKAHDVELCRTKGGVLAPTGEARRLYYFFREGYPPAPLFTDNRNTDLCFADIDRVLRLIGLDEGSMEF